MLTLFLLILVAIVLAEFIKGLSANGTPPVLQGFSWQIHLAHFMWSYIGLMRIAAAVGLAITAVLMPGEMRLWAALGAVPLVAAWAGVYWLFNRFWVGKYKFPAITVKRFVKAAENQVDPSTMVVGMEHEGAVKAYPLNMLFFHHQIPDQVGGKPVWMTYCGLCRSAQVYDLTLDGEPLVFTLVGAISFNAVFRDHRTGSWWRQETGQAAKGPLSGTQLEPLFYEQMSLASWLEKHPDSEILQYDPAFAPKYGFIDKLLRYEASLPGWHRQETPPLVIGVELDGQARAYDFDTLKRRRLVQDQLGERELLILAGEDGVSGLVYDRLVEGQVLTFSIDDDGVLRDAGTGSAWDRFGRCVEGELAGKALETIQSHQQFIRAWIAFHPQTSFYEF